MYINANRKVIPEKKFAITTNNRAFCYGDSVFESMCVHKGELLFPDLHISRMLNGLQSLQIIPPDFLSDDNYLQKHDAVLKLQKMAAQLCAKNNMVSFARIRFQCFRKEGGYYVPKTNECEWILVPAELNANHYDWNANGLHLDYYLKMQKNATLISNFKTGNSALYVLAAKYAAERNYDDIILCNNKNKIVETSRANIFFYADGVFVTPKLNDGATSGVMRKYVMDLLQRNNFVLKEISMSKEDVTAMDEAFSTNVVSGIKWVDTIGKKKFKNKTVKKVHELFIKSLV